MSHHSTYRRLFQHHRILKTLGTMFGIIMLFALISAPAAFSQPDIVIRDCPADNGNVPSYPGTCGSPYFSPDIWIRLAPDGGTVDQTPLAGQRCYVYVRLYNRGSSMLGCGVAHLYYTEASTGLSNWPVHWVSFPPYAAVRQGDQIGAACVCCIFPGQTSIVMIPWENPPANHGNEHYCLLARFLSDEDPMQNPEGTVTGGYNVPQNNNVAHKNLCHISRAAPTATISVYNGRIKDRATKLRFDVVEDIGAGDLIAAGVNPIVTLPENFPSANIEHNDDVEQLAPNRFKIVGPHAELSNFTLPAYDGDRFKEYAVVVEFPQFQQPQVGVNAEDEPYYFSMEQYEDGDDGDTEYDFVDGVMFEVSTGGGGPAIEGKTVRRPDPDLGEKLDLRAQPNIAMASTTIGFTLPAQNHVTLAIYDANGQLVRTLLAGEFKSAGMHDITWDGASAGGTLVPNGTYFYRLITPEGTVEKQLKIVR